MGKNCVHVVGTGTIGEPLIGLLSRLKDKLGIDEVTFTKRSARTSDRPKLKHLMKHGAKFVADPSKAEEFRAIGCHPSYDVETALNQAAVVIDCTPEGVGLQNKEMFYNARTHSTKGFIAQGSEFGFGKMYARGINDSTLVPGKDQFLHVVSCNTHNISALLSTLGQNGEGKLGVEEGRFLCLRRANDISQDGSFIPAPVVGKHGDAEFGTHHARDAYHLFNTLGYELNLFSSAVKLNTQYMHSMHFSIRLDRDITRDEVVQRFCESPYVAITEKMSANSVFSFGREHGHYGRILNQTVVALPTLTVRNKREVVGFCFTPQDGNSLLSSVAATLWFLDPTSVTKRLECLKPYLFDEV